MNACAHKFLSYHQRKNIQHVFQRGHFFFLKAKVHCLLRLLEKLLTEMLRRKVCSLCQGVPRYGGTHYYILIGGWGGHRRCLDLST